MCLVAGVLLCVLGSSAMNQRMGELHARRGFVSLLMVEQAVGV
jgi:hypothetical protein